MTLKNLIKNWFVLTYFNFLKNISFLLLMQITSFVKIEIKFRYKNYLLSKLQGLRLWIYDRWMLIEPVRNFANISVYCNVCAFQEIHRRNQFVSKSILDRNQQITCLQYNHFLLPHWQKPFFGKRRNNFLYIMQHDWFSFFKSLLHYAVWLLRNRIRVRSLWCIGNMTSLTGANYFVSPCLI